MSAPLLLIVNKTARLAGQRHHPGQGHHVAERRRLPVGARRGQRRLRVHHVQRTPQAFLEGAPAQVQVFPGQFDLAGQGAVLIEGAARLPVLAVEHHRQLPAGPGAQPPHPFHGGFGGAHLAATAGPVEQRETHAHAHHPVRGQIADQGVVLVQVVAAVQKQVGVKQAPGHVAPGAGALLLDRQHPQAGVILETVPEPVVVLGQGVHEQGRGRRHRGVAVHQPGQGETGDVALLPGRGQVDARLIVGGLGGEPLDPGDLGVLLQFAGGAQVAGQGVRGGLAGGHQLVGGDQPEIGAHQLQETGAAQFLAQGAGLVAAQLQQPALTLDAAAGVQRPEGQQRRAGDVAILGERGAEGVRPAQQLHQHLPHRGAGQAVQGFQVQGVEFRTLVQTGIGTEQFHLGQQQGPGGLGQGPGAVLGGGAGGQVVILGEQPPQACSNVIGAAPAPMAATPSISATRSLHILILLMEGNIIAPVDYRFPDQGSDIDAGQPAGH